MASLREIKDRISSVRSTLKITSAMKLVASSKLRKAQKEIESIRPYEKALDSILADVAGASSLSCKLESRNPDAPVAVVAVASNNSLCGGFNVNIIKQALETLGGIGSVELYSIGRKMSEALKKAGYKPVFESSELIGSPRFDKSEKLAKRLISAFMNGEYSRVILVYNSFVSASSQKPVVEQYLPFSISAEKPVAEEDDEIWDADADRRRHKFLFEPSPDEIAEGLIPQLLDLKFHAALLDSSAAEQAARTIAMQTATDNAEHLLADLTLEYNKGRQQKITAEILDLVAGSAE
ncbi:MAG: ATP synthase F1 subunit gamma [Candidatus Cryptobacteroides sp.]